MNGHSIVLALLLSVGLLAGCVGMLDVGTDYDTTFDFSRLRTYRWLPGKAAIPGRDERYGEMLDNRLRGAIERELASKGYSRADDKPDYVVTYYVALEDKVEVRVINDYYAGQGYGGYYARGGWTTPRADAYQYRLGTLIVDVIDAVSNRLVWRGTVEGEADLYKDPKKREARLNEAVQKVLARFPPR